MRREIGPDEPQTLREKLKAQNERRKASGKAVEASRPRSPPARLRPAPKVPAFGKTHPRGAGPDRRIRPKQLKIVLGDPWDHQLPAVRLLARFDDSPGEYIYETFIHALERGLRALAEERITPARSEIIRAWTSSLYEPDRTGPGTPLSELRKFHAAEGFAFGAERLIPVRAWCEALTGAGIGVEGWDGRSESADGVVCALKRRRTPRKR